MTEGPFSRLMALKEGHKIRLSQTMASGPCKVAVNGGPKNHINIRLLQTVVSGIPVVLGLRTRMPDLFRPLKACDYESYPPGSGKEHAVPQRT